MSGKVKKEYYCDYKYYTIYKITDAKDNVNKAKTEIINNRER